MKAIGCRVYRHNGAPVAQVALDRQNALLFVFRPGDAKVTAPGWRIFQEDDWAVAARSDGSRCYIVAFLGDSDDMPRVLGR